MTQVNRCKTGGRVNRDKPLRFTFNAKVLQGYEGDTLASALLANDVKIIGRSFKYHRPRGLVGAGAEEPNAIMQIGEGARTTPNIRATQQPLYQNLVAKSVNAWPSLEKDIGAIAGKLGAKVLTAGFYYKTFMWPQKAWMKYEQIIRKAAGLGHTPDANDPDRYDKTNVHCDVLVVGAGPAGLMAAKAAATGAARVMLIDDQSEPGGSLLASRADIDGMAATDWLAQTLDSLRAQSNVTLLSDATATGYFDQNFVIVSQKLNDALASSTASGPREKIHRVRAQQVVLATGAFERPLVFGNNDLPGVMTASAVSIYVNRFGVAPGKRVLLFTNNDGAYQTVLDLLSAGIKVTAVVDSRKELTGELPVMVKQAGVSVIAQSVVSSVCGNGRVQTANIMKLDLESNDKAVSAGSIGCDVIAMSGGYSPAVHLHAQSGARPVFDEARACFVPGESVQAEVSVGSCAGVWDLQTCLSDGLRYGKQASEQAGFNVNDSFQVPQTKVFEEQALAPLWLVPDEKPSGHGPKQFVDYQNDTTASDIKLAVAEGFESIEHIKRYTALGFGTDQGKLGNINGMAIAANIMRKSLPEIGTTTFRPHYTPVTFGAIAGRELGKTLFDPVRKTAMHAWHVQSGAEFEDVGQWKRPWFYPNNASKNNSPAGETMHTAVNRECKAVRESVGILDASTLGKIDIVGPDAVKLLNRIYTNAWDKLEIGRCRYGLMLSEDGMVMDDGVTTRLGENHFHMTTTTGGAATVMSWLEHWLQTEWPELDVYLTSVTDQWSIAALAGPNSRKILETVCDDVKLNDEDFPFMSYRECTVAGIPARIFRISFSGELGYEINTAANYGHELWEALMTAGEAFDITPYGTEAMHVLRAEKGFIIVGQDTDGSVTPQDLGMDWICSKKKDFIGRRSLKRSDSVKENRKQLVGISTDDPNTVLPEGAQLVHDANVAPPVPMVGHVTSSYHSTTLGRSIAMAVVKGGRGRMGETVYASLMDGKIVPARICDPVFYDKQGARQHV
ncbi:MAG: sarcosine oxidase subunit alpha family protein [Arenicellales bacterium WSBS_2016_MAG_OTU3]